MLLVCHPKILHKHCFQFLLGLFQLPRETEDNAYPEFWDDKQRCYGIFWSGQLVSLMAFSIIALIFHNVSRVFAACPFSKQAGRYLKIFKLLKSLV